MGVPKPPEVPSTETREGTISEEFDFDGLVLQRLLNKPSLFSTAALFDKEDGVSVNDVLPMTLHKDARPEEIMDLMDLFTRARADLAEPNPAWDRLYTIAGHKNMRVDKKVSDYDCVALRNRKGEARFLVTPTATTLCLAELPLRAADGAPLANAIAAAKAFQEATAMEGL